MVRPDMADVERHLSRRGWFALQSPECRKAILAAGRLVCLDRGDTVFQQGDGPGGIYGVVTGGIGVSGSTNFHGPVLAHIAREGYWFGGGPALRGGERSVTFFAMEESLLLGLGLAAIAQLEAADPRWGRRIGAVGQLGGDLLSTMVAELLIPSAERRIAATLLRVTAVLEGVTDDHPAGFRISQHQLGEMANASRNYVNMTLATFQRNGWLTLGYHRILIHDPVALSDYAASE